MSKLVLIYKMPGATPRFEANAMSCSGLNMYNVAIFVNFGAKLHNFFEILLFRLCNLLEKYYLCTTF